LKLQTVKILGTGGSRKLRTLCRKNRVDVLSASGVKNAELEIFIRNEYMTAGVEARNAVLNATDIIDTAAITGQSIISAFLNVSDNADAANIAASVLVSGIVSIFENGDDTAILAENIISAALNVSDSPDDAEITASAIVSAEISATDQQDIAHIIASTAGDRSAVLVAVEDGDRCKITARHDAQPRERTHISLSRISLSPRMYQRYAKIEIKENADGVKIKALAGVSNIVLLHENKDGIKTYAHIVSTSIMCVSENKDGIQNDADEFHRIIEAQNLKYEQAEIELLAMVA